MLYSLEEKKERKKTKVTTNINQSGYGEKGELKIN